MKEIKVLLHIILLKRNTWFLKPCSVYASTPEAIYNYPHKNEFLQTQLIISFVVSLCNTYVLSLSPMRIALVTKYIMNFCKKDFKEAKGALVIYVLVIHLTVNGV